MSQKSDVMYKNHCVSPTSKEALIDGDERVIIQFSTLERTKDGKKYVRASINASRKIMREIIEKYGLAEIVVNRWEIWDKEQKKNIPYVDN